MTMDAIRYRTFSDVLEQISSEADKCFEKGFIKIGQEISLVADSLKAAYKDSMNETVDKIDVTVQQILDALYSFGLTMNRGGISKVDQITFDKQFEKIYSTLPPNIFEKAPKIKQMDGIVIDPLRGNSEALLTITGKFQNISRESPYLLIHSRVDPRKEGWKKVSSAVAGLIAGGAAYFYPEHRIEALLGGAMGIAFNQQRGRISRLESSISSNEATGLQTLTFPIDKSLLNQSDAGLAITNAELIIPKGLSPDKFHVKLVSLPPSPGTIILEVPLLKKDARQTLVHVLELRSSKSLKLGDQKKKITMDPPPGWKFDAKTIKIEEKLQQSPQGFFGISHGRMTQDRVEVEAWTKQNAQGPSGVVRYEISCEAVYQLPTSPESVNQEIIPLSWGDSVIRKIDDAFKIRFKSSDGWHIEINGTENRVPYIEVISQDDQVTIRAKRPSEIII